MMAILTLTESEFYEQYDLIHNHLDVHAGFDGNLFETYGAELEFVLSMVKSKRVVTVIESTDDQDQSIITFQSGFHYVNRLGYLVTKTEIIGDFIVNAA